MPWETSTRRMPPGWHTLRKQILERDGHRCTMTTNGWRCTQVATDVHHVGASTDHSDTNLVSLCTQHHAAITKTQTAAARWRYRTARTPEPHPGLK